MFFWNCLAFSMIQHCQFDAGSSAFSKSSLNIWKFTVHVLLKPGLENFEHYFYLMVSCHYLIFLITFEQTYPHFGSTLEPTSYRVSSRWKFFCGDYTFTKLIKLYFKKKRKTFILSWDMVSHCRASFGWTAKELSHTYACIHSPLKPSHAGCHIILSRVLKWVGLLFYIIKYDNKTLKYEKK